MLFNIVAIASIALHCAVLAQPTSNSTIRHKHGHDSYGDPLTHAHLHHKLEYGTPESHGYAMAPLQSRASGAIAPGIELRILPLGDSITYGYASPDGNGYRLKLDNDLAADNVVFAGTVQSGNMIDNWMAGYPGHTIQYIAGQAGGSLAQKPNIVLLMAGTNDMNPNPSTSTEGTNAQGAVTRLANLVDQVLAAVPGTVVLVAKVPQVAAAAQNSNINAFNALIPAMVNQRASAGKYVRLVDMSVIGVSLLTSDGVHPSEAGYQKMGDIWYQAMAAIPKAWIKPPAGPDPSHSLNCKGTNALAPVISSGPSLTGAQGDINANGGPDPNIPPPGFHLSKLTCEIALGVGHNGNWHYQQGWVSGGEIVSGLHLDMPGVQLYDMDGDGKAEYLWVNEKTGQLICWYNKWPALWAPCGNNNGIIASGAGPRANVFFADMNGDGKTDYLVVNGNTGAVTVYWNEGPDASFVNGWRFTPGGVIASGVPHANLRTIRFADMDGDGRADYVIVGVGGALGLWLNTGTQGGHDVLFVAQGGIATGATSDIDSVILKDINGDGRADYLIWDSIGGLSGFLNVRTRDDGLPYFAAQGGSKSIADGITQLPASIRLADIDGDGWLDYCYIDTNGALWIWWNRGSADTSVTGDGVRLADIDGDGVDDYIWLDVHSGAPSVWLNKGPNAGAPDGWLWSALNGGQPIASGAGARAQVHFGDVDGDNRTDYLVLDPDSGEVTAYLNKGADKSAPNGWRWQPIGSIASGLGPGANSRFADIDGDGKADYIELSAGGKAVVWKNNEPKAWSPFAIANAAGINRPPQEITFADINGDGKADYIWTEAISGQPHVWYNQLPATPAWKAGSYLSISRDGVDGQSILYAKLQKGKGAVPVFVNPDTGALAAFVNGCTGQAGKREVSAPSPIDSTPVLKRELRKRDSCGNVLSPTPSPLPIINGCPTGVYNPYRPFHDPPCTTGGWLSIQCTLDGLTGAADPGRWYYADCDDAWDNVMRFWNNYLTYTKNDTYWTFSVAASQYFHGPDQFQCQDIDEPTYCPISIECPDAYAPAGWLILESLTLLHGFGYGVQEALQWAVGNVTLNLDAFGKQFTETVDTTRANLIIDGIVLGASIGVSGLFSTIIKGIVKSTSQFGEKSGEFVKDLTFAGIGSANGFTKDILGAYSTQQDVTVALKAALNDLGGVFYSQTEAFFTNLLDPRWSGAQELLQGYLKSTFLLTDTQLWNPHQLRDQAMRALWGAILKFAWHNSPKKVYPFVLRLPKAAYTCGKSVTTAKAIQGESLSLSKLQGYPPDLSNAVWCDNEGAAYFLLDAGDGVAVDGCTDFVCSGGGGHLPVNLLPGGTNDVLKNPSLFGNITVEDIVSSNWAAFRANNYQNDFASPQNTGLQVQEGTVDTLPTDLVYGGGINMPGFFNFPVCVSVGVIDYEHNHWSLGGDRTHGPYDYDKYYPCGLYGGKNRVDVSTYTT